MSNTENFAPARSFDPAAWLAEYEAVGGNVSVVRWIVEGKDGLWLGITYPRDEAGRGYAMLEELNAGNASGGEGRRRNRALLDYVVATKGVIDFRRTRLSIPL